MNEVPLPLCFDFHCAQGSTVILPESRRGAFDPVRYAVGSLAHDPDGQLIGLLCHVLNRCASMLGSLQFFRDASDSTIVMLVASGFVETGANIVLLG